MSALPLAAVRDFLRQRPALVKVAFSAWGLFVFLPAVLSALRPNPKAGDAVKFVTGLFGADVGGYLGYSPGPLLAYAVAAVVFSPLVLLLIAVGEGHSTGAPRTLTGLIGRTLGEWLILHALSIAVLSAVVVLGGADAAGVWSWTWRLAAALGVSGLAPAAIACAVAAAVETSRRAVFLGAFVVVGLGLWGAGIPQPSTPIAPGAIDRALLSGAPGVPWAALFSAVAWVCGVTVAGLGASRLRRRMSSDLTRSNRHALRARDRADRRPLRTRGARRRRG